MSRYDDPDDVGGRLSPWEEPADQVNSRRRWRRRDRQDDGGRYAAGRDAGGWNEQRRDSRPVRGRRRLRKEVVLGTAAILATVIVISTSLVAYARYRTVYSSIKRVAVSSAELGKHRPPYTAAQNILVIGSDSRAGSNGHGNAAVITGARSDTVMLLHIAPGHQRADIISFPRDSMVPIYACQADSAQGLSGQQAQPAGDLEPLNSTFAYGGPVCLWKTIEQQTDIRIQHFIEVDFSGFQSIVDDVGGVDVCLPEAIDAPAAGLNLPKGIDPVTGTQALAFVRAREGVGDGSDLERIQRQQFFLDAVLQKLKSTNLLADPARILQVVTDAAKSITVDSGLDLSTMLKIADSMKSLNSGDVDFISVPNGLYPPDPAKVLWTQPEADQLFQAIANDKTVPAPAAKAASTPSAPPATVSPSEVKVDVLNGAGTTGLAAIVRTDLTSAGFTVTGTGDVPGFGFTGSVIEYSSASQLAEANTLKARISGATVKLDTNVLSAGSITLIVGSSFNGLSSATSSSPSPAPSPSSSASNLTKTYGGITGTTNICQDSAAFAP
jgi:LCP family protein required for cell wall assembly